MSSEEEKYEIINLPKMHEYRIESNSAVEIILLDGTAEINGMDLVKNKNYEIQSSLVFSYTGCNLKVQSSDDFFGYISADTNIPNILEFIKKTGDWNIKGDGRTTFVKTVMNYGIRHNKKIVLTVLDPSFDFFCKGVIGQCFMNDPFTEFDFKNMILFNYGKNSERDDNLYKEITKKIKSLKINYDLNLIISDLQFPKVCVVNNERMFYKLKDVPEKHYIKKTGGYQQIDKPLNKNLKAYFNDPKYRKYFLKYTGKIYRIGEDTETPTTALPIGKSTQLDDYALNETSVSIGDVIAITYGDENNLVESIKTFGVIKEIGENNTYKILLNQPKLPTGLFLKTPNVLSLD